MFTLRRILLTTLLSVALSAPAFATILNVPEDIETIVEAVQNAEPGDTVLVFPGVYSESIDFDGRRITLASLYLLTGDEAYLDSTVIDPERLNASGIRFSSGENEEAQVVGFTIQNAQTDFGGGVYIRQSSPTVRKMRFRANHAEEAGGGLYVTTNASPLIEDCEFIANTAADVGGGLACYGGAEPTLRNLYFTDNTSASYGGGLYGNGSNPAMSGITILNSESGRNGGGMYFTQGCRAHGDSITLRSNRAQRGGGMCVYNQALVELTTVVLDSNTAVATGGGILCSNSSSLILNDAIVTSNRTTDVDNGVGGAIYCNEDAGITITDALFAFNQSHYSTTFHQIAGNVSFTRALFYSNNFDPSTTTCTIKDQTEFVNCAITGNLRPISVDIDAEVLFRNCILWNDEVQEIIVGNAPNNITVSISFSDIEEGEDGVAESEFLHLDWGEGNLNVDPLFLNPEEFDYHLTPPSACIDAGCPDDEPDPDGSQPDMGALPFLYGVLEGLVRDAVTGDRLEDCVITNNTGIRAVTNNQGYYRFQPVGEGEFELTATAAGYNSGTQAGLTVPPGEYLEVNFDLTCAELTPSVESLGLTLRTGEQGALPFMITNTGVGDLSFTVAPELSGDRYAAPWTNLYNLPAGAQVEDPNMYAAVFAGDRFFVAGSGNNNPRFHIFNREGEFTQSVPQIRAGAGNTRGFRDLEWDGELIWGVTNDTIWAFTPEMEIQFAIPSPIRYMDCLAVNPVDAVVWLASVTSNFYEVSYDGELLREIPRQGLRTYGLTWWAEDADGCPLYVDVRPVGADIWLHKINPETRQIVPVTDVGMENSGAGLGLSVTMDYFPQNWTLMRMVNLGDDDILEALELAGDTHWMTVEPQSGVVEEGDQLEMTLRLDASDLSEGNWEGNLAFHHPTGRGIRSLLPVALTVEVDAAPLKPGSPEDFELAGPYPNPFNSTTRVDYYLPQAGRVRLGLFDLNGRLVMDLMDGTDGMDTPGRHSITLDGTVLPAGVYFLRLESSGRVDCRKAAVVK